jgi:hypothetical protein
MIERVALALEATWCDRNDTQASGFVSELTRHNRMIEARAAIEAVANELDEGAEGRAAMVVRAALK